MKIINLTCPSPQENLAADEIFLEACEEGRSEELLRFWEPDRYFVVLGCGGRKNTEVNCQACDDLQIPILRRPSGGGTVLQGAGCLNYSLFLRIQPGTPLAHLTRSNHYILEKIKNALQPLLPQEIRPQGLTDLTLGNLKFSGNAQKRKRSFLLFHGCFLLQMDFSLMEKVLQVPSRQPGYRENRTHRNFLTNLPLPASRVKESLQAAWDAQESLQAIPHEEIKSLALAKYSDHAWNFKF